MSSIVVLISRRIAANWRLMAALALGFVVAVGLMASTVIYADALDDLGLDFAIGQTPQDSLNSVAVVPARLNRAEAGPMTAAMEETFSSGPGRFTSAAVRALRSGTFYLAPPGGAVNLEDPARPRAYFQSRAGYEDHIVVEGALPSGTLAGDAVEAAIGAPSARRLGVAIGDIFDLYPFWDDELPPLRVNVVGIVTRVDDAAGYWTDAGSAFDHRTQNWDTYPFFVDERALVDGIGTAYPDVPGEISLIGLVDPGTLSAGTAASARAAFEGFRRYLVDRFPTVRYESALPDTIAAYQDRLTFSRIPLTVIILQIVGIALYYLVMVASMLVERQAGEVALLKSRGGTTGQVMGIYLIEGIALSLVALLAGPPLAAGVVALLGRTPVFSDLTGGGPLDAPLGLETYLVAAGGAIFALGALLVPALFATRRTIVHYKQSSGRHDATPFFFKYYLDLFFIGLLGLLFIRLEQEGALASDDLFGGIEVDPVVLLSPALFLLTAGVLFLRVFPLVLRLIGMLLARTRLTSLVVATWHLVRNPTHYGRLVLMLVLATSLGTFAAGFGSTLNESYADRAAYEAGAEARVVDLRPRVPDATTLYEGVDDAPGVVSAAAVLRESADYRLDTFNGLTVDVLGIDSRFPGVAFFRDDFADKGISSIAGTLEDPAYEAPAGPAIREGDTWLSIWIRVESDPGAGAQFQAQVRDRTGVVRDVRLNVAGAPPPPRFGNVPPLEVGRWLEYEGQLPDGAAPFTLQGITFSRVLNLGDDRGALLVDNVRSFSYEGGLRPAASSAFALVTSFEDPAPWEAVSGQGGSMLADRVEPGADAHEGETALRLSWSERLPRGVERGIRLVQDSSPLPAFASESFLAASGKSAGDVVRISTGGAFFDVELYGAIAYFPTIASPVDDPFMVVSLERFVGMANANPALGESIGPRELWMQIDRDLFDADALLERLPGDSGGLVFESEVAATREEDPLTAAGWQGILVIAFGAVLLLSAIGFVVYSYLSAEARRLEFAILRTLGLTRRQVAMVVTAEQALVVVVGMTVGSVVGLRLGPGVIGYLGITESGGDVVPPYRTVTDWFTIATTYSTLLAVFAGATGLIAALYTRLAIHRVLRLGEL